MTKRIFLVFLTFLFAASAFAEPVPPATNKDGSVVSGFVTANFDPLNEQYPLPWNFLFLGTDDLTLNPPVDDPNDYSDPLVALSAIDGFSTTERWITTFSSFPNAINSSTVAAGQTVRFFEVSTVLGTIVIVNGIVRELTPGVDYMINLTETGVLAILPLKPLKEMTTYMAVITNDITDTAGNNATPSSTYHLSKAETPWIDENGNSTSPFFSDASAATLESLRRMTFSMETAAASVGIPREDIILSWTAQTQSITPVTKAVRSTARPAPTQVLPTGLNTSVLGAPGIADIYMGIITLPYYLGVPSAENPTAPLTDFWTAAPGAYVPPFDGFGLNPESTNVTIANPFPVKTSDQTVPLLLTVPNANSGKQKPAAGWPIVIFGHAVGQNRANLLPVADAFAAAGYAVIGIDSTLHGIAQDDPVLGLLNVENGPWADVANERTFNVDYINNETGAPGPDGIPDPSGAHVINLRSLLTSRDNARQAQADLSVLAVTLPTIDIDLDGLPDLDASTVRYAGMGHRQLRVVLHRHSDGRRFDGSHQLDRRSRPAEKRRLARGDWRHRDSEPGPDGAAVGNRTADPDRGFDRVRIDAGESIRCGRRRPLRAAGRAQLPGRFDCVTGRYGGDAETDGFLHCLGRCCSPGGGCIDHGPRTVARVRS
jgi:hypothetical protein